MWVITKGGLWEGPFMPIDSSTMLRMLERSMLICGTEKEDFVTSESIHSKYIPRCFHNSQCENQGCLMTEVDLP